MRKKSLRILKENLWDVFSLYWRRFYADENGMTKCITCPKVAHWKELQLGHCYPKSLGMAMYFDVRNVRPQCASCNLRYQGRQYKFIEALTKIYGPSIDDELYKQSKTIRPFKRWEFEEMIEEYKKKLSDLDGVIFGARS